MLKLAILEKVVIALYVILIGTWLWMVYENRKIKREFSKDGQKELEQLERLAELRRERRIPFQREAELDRRIEELAQRIRELEAEIAALKKRQLDSRQSYSTT